MNKKVLVVVGVLIFVALASFARPHEVMIVPDWTIDVVDQQGKPLSGATVSEHWRHYSVEDFGNEAEVETSDDGRARFPARSIRASLAERFFGCLRQIQLVGVHAGCGPHAYAIVSKRGFSNSDAHAPRSGWFQESRGQKTKVTLVQCPPGKTGFACMDDLPPSR